MAFRNSPYTVTNGLVLCLDAANPKSYISGSTNLTDLTGYVNSAILSGSTFPTYNTFNGGSIGLNGSNNYIKVVSNSSIVRLYNSTTQFVVKLPIYTGGQRCILSFRGGGGGNLYVGKSSGGIFCYYNELNTASYIIGNIPNNDIVQITITCDAGNNLLTTYINGNSLGSVARTGWVSNYCSSSYLGYDIGTNEYMTGSFYSFLHYNRVLSSGEILQNYNAMKGRFGLR